MNEQLELFPLPSTPESMISKINCHGKPRLNLPLRDQLEFVQSSIDDLIAEDHQVRNIWEYVTQMNLDSIVGKIKSTDCNPGRPAIDPRVLLALWIYAIIEGIGSARLIERYCTEHLAFRWLCGGVSVNYHSISDFRRNNTNEIDNLISNMISRLIHKGLVSLKQVSQDGMKVRASAGTSSFRRKPKLKELYETAKKQVEILRKEIDQDPSSCQDRRLAAKKRAAEDRKNRIEQALKEHKNLNIEKGLAKKKQRKPFTQAEKDEIRSSTTDPEARKMKMAHGGFGPAYNMQIAIDTESRFIVGFEAIKKNNDYGQLSKMFDKIKKKYLRTPERYLVDQGYLVHEDIIYLERSGCEVYVNPIKSEKKTKEEIPELIKWRIRMGMEEAKEVYKNRASNSEWANAGMRNRGLRQLLVRGLKNIQSTFNLHVLTHNLLRGIKLGYVL